MPFGKLRGPLQGAAQPFTGTPIVFNCLLLPGNLDFPHSFEVD